MASTTAYQPFFGYVDGQVNQDLGPYGPVYDGFLTTHSTLGRPGHSAHVSQTSRRPHHFRHSQFRLSHLRLGHGGIQAAGPISDEIAAY